VAVFITIDIERFTVTVMVDVIAPLGSRRRDERFLIITVVAPTRRDHMPITVRVGCIYRTVTIVV